MVTSDSLEFKLEIFCAFPAFGICPGRGLCCAGMVHSLLKTLLSVKCEISKTTFDFLSKLQQKAQQVLLFLGV